MTTKGRYLLGAGVVVALAAGLYALQGERAIEPPLSRTGVGAGSLPSIEAARGTAMPAPAKGVPGQERPRPVAHPFPALPRSRTGLPLDDDPFGAGSVAEQRWLDRNGFPNAQQWQTYSVATDAALEQAALAGDRIAAVMLDSRRLAMGDEHAIARLMAAAERGSIFALNMLATYMAGSRNGDPEFGYALSRVQEMRGDTRIVFARDMMFREPLNGEQLMRGEVQALHIFATLRQRSREGSFVDYRPFVPPPAPGRYP